MRKDRKYTYDLEDRLLEYSVQVVKIIEQLPKTRTGNHVAGQMLRSGTSPYPNHGEAQAAESPKDFIHKLRISLNTSGAIVELAADTRKMAFRYSLLCGKVSDAADGVRSAIPKGFPFWQLKSA